MYRIIFAMLSLLMVFGIIGCGSVPVNVDLRDCPYPVMCSPIMRIGDTAPPKKDCVAFDEFSTEADTAFSCSYWDSTQKHYGPRYITTVHTHSESTFKSRTDNIASGIQKATAGRSDIVVVVNEIKNECYQHNSIFGFVTDRICVEGKTVLAENFKK